MPELYKQVPSDWTYYYPIYDRAVASAPRGSTLIEVGSFWGKGAIYLAELCQEAHKDLRCYSIDLWGMNPDNNPFLFDKEAAAKGHIEPQTHALYHDNLFETMAHFVGSTRLSPDPLRIMRMDTFEAAGFFSGISNIHMVFLDNDHEYGHVLKELKTWAPMIRDGGIIAGDDWTEEFWGVKKAVFEYFYHRIPCIPEIINERCWMVQL